ncbi:hypothetical protein [Alteribacillus sp. HJP-4]|uniref:hypothetical protein n=1 Tax=Alteribacillus sp. HJP-4 TaxID=2775394 RepID=UPI0035CCECB9
MPKEAEPKEEEIFLNMNKTNTEEVATMMEQLHEQGVLDKNHGGDIRNGKMDMSKAILIVAKLAFEAIKEDELSQTPQQRHAESWEKATRKGVFTGKEPRQKFLENRLLLL